MSPPTITHSGDDLTVADRALLDLSRHGIEDGKLGQLLGVDDHEIARRRVRAEREEARFERVMREAVGVQTDADEPRFERPAATPDEPVASASVAPPQPKPLPRSAARARLRLVDRAMQLVAGSYLLALLAAILIYKGVFAQALAIDPLFGIYGIVVTTYLVSRFGMALFYRMPKLRGLEPRVAIIMPAFNEEAAIAHSLRSLLTLDYPLEKLEIVAVNDGSTDSTLAQLRALAAENDAVHVIDFPENRGKRAAMAAGIRATNADIIAFVDSDSALAPDALRQLVQEFHDERVGAVCGHADVLNAHENWITRMQAVRYFVAFRVIKAAESIFNCVTCCSGCFSAYRREAIMPHLDWWEHQSFLGRHATFGDDRSLTNCVLKTWKVRYVANAVSETMVPNTFRVFMRQQLRWKRSWTRESLILGRFVWRRHPVAAITTYVGILLNLVAPLAAIRTLLWQPIMGDSGFPFIYLVGMYAMAVAYGLYYLMRRGKYDPVWIWGIAFCFFYLLFLVWQTPYAILTSASSDWGTRPATAGKAPAATATALAPAEAAS